MTDDRNSEPPKARFGSKALSSSHPRTRGKDVRRVIEYSKTRQEGAFKETKNGKRNAREITFFV